MQPSIFIGRENTVGLAHLGQHFAALKNHVVFVGLQADTSIGQYAAHFGIAFYGGGFIVMVGKYFLHMEFLGEAGDFFHRFAVADDQTNAFLCAQGL